MWDKINVWQYQQIYNALNTKDKDATDLDLEVKLVGIVNNMTEMQIDSLPLSEYKELGKTIAFLNEPIEGTPKKHINVSHNKRYKINYNISKMPFARYIESKVFSEDLYGNLHKLAATMVIPQKRKFGIWFNQKYDASMHQEYANDMLDAKFVDVYHSLVFFYQVYKNWIEISKDYMIAGMIQAGMTESQADIMAHLLSEFTDGTIPVTLLPPKKISELKKSLK